MNSDKNSGEAGVSREALEALPAGSTFQIDFDRTGKTAWVGEIFIDIQRGEIKAGGYVRQFSADFSVGYWRMSDYFGHWRESAERLVSGHDRSAFVFNTAEGPWGWGSAFPRRLLAWREGERVYISEDTKTPDIPLQKAPYGDIPSLGARCASDKPKLWALTLQAFRDYLTSRDPRFSLEEIERPCPRCGREMRRCNHCDDCMSCGGGVGDEELGHCVKCRSGRQDVERFTTDRSALT